MRKIIVSLLGFLILSSLSLSSISRPVQAAGATLFLSPASGSYEVNKSFTVKVMVNSGGGVGINAAEGTIKYDPAYLTVSNVSKSSSIFKLWTTEPTYSNTAGTISFGGGAPGAYVGNAGTICVVTFVAKKNGTAKVTFTSGVILAADGKGTNIFSGFGNGEYTITEAKKKETKKKKIKKPKEKEKIKGILPPLPEVNSPTHPDENKWYSNNDPEFSWKILSDLTNISYSISHQKEDPGLSGEGVTETKRFEDVEDGEWYFNIKYKNKVGWGEVAHRKFLVDVTPPEEFTISLDNGGDPTNPTPRLRFQTTDATSGIDHYVVTRGFEAKNIKPEEVATGYYKMPALAPGEYRVTIAAIDKADNSASSSISFIVDPLKAPIISDIPKVISRKGQLIIRGTSFYPRVTVKIYLAKGENDKDKQEFSVTTDDQGNWSYFHTGKLEKGTYQVWTKIIDNRGAQSLDSTKHILTVTSPSIVCAYGLWIIIGLVLAVIILILYILYQHKEFKEEKSRIKAETIEMKTRLRKIFAALREETDELLELADKRPGLSESERKVKEKLQESLDIAEEFISKEVEDVEKEINLKKEKIEE
jgi:hypothetical protein